MDIRSTGSVLETKEKPAVVSVSASAGLGRGELMVFAHMSLRTSYPGFRARGRRGGHPGAPGEGEDPKDPES